jgi:hypothetical protein
MKTFILRLGRAANKNKPPGTSGKHIVDLACGLSLGLEDIAH